ncbi:MAG: hypothetical protein ACKPKO_10530 [Candidatus Fonsibacter sp.]
MKFNFNNLASNEVQCKMIGTEPWFRGTDVAKNLAFACPSKAIIDRVPEKFKKPLEFLMAAAVCPISGLTDLNDHTNKKSYVYQRSRSV